MAEVTKLLSVPQVCERLNVGRSKFYGLIKAGVIPAPVKIGGSSRWPEAEIEGVIARFVAQRDGEAA